MPAMKRYSTLTRSCGVVAAILVVAAVLGCGDSSNSSTVQGEIDFSKRTFAHCLKENGADFAASGDDLEFFAQAEDEDSASHSGFSSDPSAQLVIDLYEDAEDPREWLLWTAHPPGESPSPLEIAERIPWEGYVAYIVEPSASERKALEGC